MTTTYCLKSLRQFFFKLLLHSSNLLSIAHMEVKFCAHVYYIVSMTTTTTNSLRHLSLKFTSSLLKLANCSTHGDETWCARVLHRFHDDHNNKKARELFFIIISSLLKLANCSTYGDETWYACVLNHFHDDGSCRGRGEGR